jgi:hypothetical protein
VYLERVRLALPDELRRPDVDVVGVPAREPRTEPVLCAEPGTVVERRRCDDGVEVVDLQGLPRRRVGPKRIAHPEVERDVGVE